MANLQKLDEHKKEKTRERNKRNNERLKEARENLYKKNPTKIIKCTSCNENKKISDFYKSNIHVRFVDKKPVDITTGECKKCACLKQKKRDEARAKS